MNDNWPRSKAKQKSFASMSHAFFLTFSCHDRRRLLDDDAAKGIVINVLSEQLEKRKGRCLGFVIMPDHVHTVVWFPAPDELAEFIKQWKRLSSYYIRKNLEGKQPQYHKAVRAKEPIWQRRYYCFNLYSETKIKEKLDYMHNNPLKAGLVAKPELWPFSSARYYLLEQPVGIDIGMPG
ncbi:MAG: transposase [Desulfarculaceae bacterium]|nr:transposase [Desulfarculaceae bacterium]